MIDLEEAVGQYKNYTHASHVLFWTKDNSRGQEGIYGLMQMRSDGRLGFPGGKSDEKTVDKNEILSALYREIQEEMDFTLFKGQITLDDRISTHLSKSGKILHFFAKELPLIVFQRLEKTYTNAQSFPSETVGLIRVPLSGKPLRKFFINFGKQVFAGNARNQLICSVLKLNLILNMKDVDFFTKMMSN